MHKLENCSTKYVKGQLYQYNNFHGDNLKNLLFVEENQNETSMFIRMYKYEGINPSFLGYRI